MIDDKTITTPNAIRSDWRAFLKMLIILFKVRVVFLLLLAALGGAFLGQGKLPSLENLLLIIVTGGLAACGSGALNQYIERDKDGRMGRTHKRPLVNGQIANSKWALWIGMGMILLPVLATLPFNPALSFFLLLGAVIYVAIYTLWLKPRTLLNIVIGGAAGSAAVMSGGASVGAWQDPAVIVLALLVFLWTPTHFWSLAIIYRDDYRRADVPMLPAQLEISSAAWWVMVHTIPTGLAALLLAVVPALGWFYLLPVLFFTADLIWRNIQLIRHPTTAHAKSLFIASNLYLTIILLAIFIDILL